MATLKLVLDQRRTTKSGSFPLRFRLNHLTKTAEISTGILVQKMHFDPKRQVVLDDDLINDQLLDQRKMLEARLKKIPQEVLDKLNANQVRDRLLVKTTQEFTIISFWEEEVERLVKTNRLGNAQVYKMTLNVLKQVIDLNVPFQSITLRDVMNLEALLAARSVKVNSIGVYLRTFKAICNRAIKQDLVDYSWYPFRKFTIRKEKTVPRVLTLAEMQRFFNLNIQPVGVKHKYWCIGKLLFMLRGINIRDLINLKPSNIKNGRLIYKRAKTGKFYSIYLTKEMQQIFDQFQDGHTLLSIISKQEMESRNLVQIYHQHTKIINKHLRHFGRQIQTSEEITTYVFRYSYANIAKQLGYSKDLIAEALGHEYGNKVTGIYLEQFDQGIIDQMNAELVAKVQQSDNAPF